MLHGARTPAVFALLVALSLGGLACGDGPASPTNISTGGSSTLNVAGTWSGSASDSLGQMVMTWQLTQTGRDVTGTVTATTSATAPLYSGGTITGSISGTTFTFAVTIPRGGVVESPDCSVALSGTATDITANGMSGTYSGADSCLGAFAGGRFTFAKI